MKKLFFSAALAIVAIGSALSVNAITVYTADLGSGGTARNCSNGSISCENISLYYEQFSPQTAVDPADVEDTKYN